MGGGASKAGMTAAQAARGSSAVAVGRAVDGGNAVADWAPGAAQTAGGAAVEGAHAVANFTPGAAENLAGGAAVLAARVADKMSGLPRVPVDFDCDTCLGIVKTFGDVCGSMPFVGPIGFLMAGITER